MTEEDEEFNRIEREAAMRTAAVKATMTLRDDIAIHAMQGIICAPNADDDTAPAIYLSAGLGFSDGMRGRIAVAAYAMADAMLKAKQA